MKYINGHRNHFQIKNDEELFFLNVNSYKSERSLVRYSKKVFEILDRYLLLNKKNILQHFLRLNFCKPPSSAIGISFSLL